MCGCAFIEYNNRSAKLKGIVSPNDKVLILYALTHWAIIAFNIRNNGECFTRMCIDDWVEGITSTIKPSTARDLAIAALFRCRPETF